MIEPVTIDGMTIRELPPDEWARLAGVPGGVLEGRADILDGPPDTARVIVLEDETGLIQGYTILSARVHVEPMYVTPAYRHHAKSGLAMLGAVAVALQDSQVGYIYAIIADGDQPTNGRLAEKLGLTPVPGRLYAGPVPPPEDS